MDVRIRQRRASVRREQRRRRLRRSLVVLTVVAVGAVLWAVERSPLVALDTIIVEGNEHVSAEEIRDVAALRLGTSTLRLDLGGAAERVTAMPAVRQAQVRRVDAVTVRINVVERVAELRLRTPTRRWLVDRDGVVFAAGNGPPTMPIILTDDEVSLGADATASGLREVVAIHAGLSGPLRARVTAYRLDAPTDVALLLEGDLVARLGDASQLDEKIRAVGALLAEIEGTDVTHIDVRVPSRPVVAAR